MVPRFYTYISHVVRSQGLYSELAIGTQTCPSQGHPDGGTVRPEFWDSTHACDKCNVCRDTDVSAGILRKSINSFIIRDNGNDVKCDIKLDIHSANSFAECPLEQTQECLRNQMKTISHMINVHIHIQTRVHIKNLFYTSILHSHRYVRKYIHTTTCMLIISINTAVNTMFQILIIT